MIINGTVGRICKVWAVFQVFLGHVHIYVHSTAYLNLEKITLVTYKNV